MSPPPEYYLIRVHLIGDHIPDDVAVGRRVEGVRHHEVIGVVTLEVFHDKRVCAVAPLEQTSPRHPD